MRLEINDKPQELEFSFDFIERMDKEYATDSRVKDMGVGLSMGLNLLERSYSPKALVDVIYAATNNVAKKDVKEYIENYAIEEGTLEPLFEEIIDEVKKAPMLTATLKKMDKLMEQYQNQNEPSAV